MHKARFHAGVWLCMDVGCTASRILHSEWYTSSVCCIEECASQKKYQHTLTYITEKNIFSTKRQQHRAPSGLICIMLVVKVYKVFLCYKRILRWNPCIHKICIACMVLDSIIINDIIIYIYPCILLKMSINKLLECKFNEWWSRNNWGIFRINHWQQTFYEISKSVTFNRIFPVNSKFIYISTMNTMYSFSLWFKLINMHHIYPDYVYTYLTNGKPKCDMLRGLRLILNIS